MNIYGYMINYYSASIQQEVRTYGLVKADTDENAFSKVHATFISDENDELFELSIHPLEYSDEDSFDFIDCEYLEEFMDEAQRRGLR